MFARENLHRPFIVSPALNWKEAWSDRGFSLVLSLTLAYLAGMVVFLNRFLPYINRRDGILLHDPILARIPPHDLSYWIFSVIYLSILAAVVFLITKPGLVMRGLITLALVYTLRIITLYFVPLDPPAGCVPLADPFILHFAYGGVLITRDLFFSGHTACMLTLALAVRRGVLKGFLFAALVAVIALLLIQHAHYTIDILGALVVTPLCWSASKKVTA